MLAGTDFRRRADDFQPEVHIHLNGRRCLDKALTIQNSLHKHFKLLIPNKEFKPIEGLLLLGELELAFMGRNSNGNRVDLNATLPSHVNEFNLAVGLFDLSLCGGCG